MFVLLEVLGKEMFCQAMFASGLRTHAKASIEMLAQQFRLPFFSWVFENVFDTDTSQIQRVYIHTCKYQYINKQNIFK